MRGLKDCFFYPRAHMQGLKHVLQSFRARMRGLKDFLPHTPPPSQYDLLRARLG